MRAKYWVVTKKLRFYQKRDYNYLFLLETAQQCFDRVKMFFFDKYFP